MSDDDLYISPMMDMSDDLWWVFYVPQDVDASLVRAMVDAFLQRGGQVVREYSSDPYLQCLMRDKASGVYFELLNASDDVSPFLFLAMQAEQFVPPEYAASRLHADLFLELGKVCYHVMRPRYAFAESPDLFVDWSDIEAARITHVCWAQFFGPQFVVGIGREVLRNAPAWRSENLGDGGILYVLSASPYLGRGPRQYWEAARQYFSRHIAESILWSDLPQEG
jgi:hypothetical protein